MLPLPDGMQRMESGPVQFGDDDWPGVFLRGDESMYLAHVLESAADVLAGAGDVLGSMQLRSAAKGFAACKAT